MNNRELATFILLGAGFVLVLIPRDLRHSAGRVLKCLLSPKLCVPLLVFVSWTTVAAWLARVTGFWTSELAASTVLWFLFVGMAWFIHIGEAGEVDDFLNRRIVEAVKVGALLEVFINLEVMSLPAELILMLFSLFVGMLDLVARQKVEFKPVARLTSTMLIIVGLGLVSFTVYRLADDWHRLAIRDVVNQFVLPVWLTVASVPCIYVIALYMGYDSLLVNMSLWNNNRKPSAAALAGVVRELKGSLVDISQFRGIAARQAATTTSFRVARQAVHDFKQKRADDRAVRAAARGRLEAFAGVPGTDSDGLMLDRREFAETKEALRWLATCHMGWYQNEDRPDTYRPDLLSALGDFIHQGLPEDHGIQMKVRKDGQAWYAYRVSPSGYVFGIGANGPPPSQWFYDGSHPPSGYPSAKGGWTSIMESDGQEWQEEAPAA
jgi:hypothetical protein